MDGAKGLLKNKNYKTCAAPIIMATISHHPYESLCNNNISLLKLYFWFQKQIRYVHLVCSMLVESCDITCSQTHVVI